MAPAHRTTFWASCEKVRAETDLLQAGLNSVPSVTAFPTDANYVFCKVDSKIGTASDLVWGMLDAHNIFLKNCAGKTMPDAQQFFRVASRSQAENERLVAALKDVVATLEARAP